MVHPPVRLIGDRASAGAPERIGAGVIRAHIALWAASRTMSTNEPLGISIPCIRGKLKLGVGNGASFGTAAIRTDSGGALPSPARLRYRGRPNSLL
jgi:hypothetical protein